MAEPIVKNAADEDQVKKADIRIKRGRDQELDDVHFILSTPQGRRFFWRLLSMCHMYETSFTGNNLTTCFNEGERNVGLKIQGDIIEAKPDALLQMMTENKKEEQNNA